MQIWPTDRKRHAVVIGGGVSGLAAAGALSALQMQVTVLEADDPGDSIAPRKGVPQGGHSHGLLKSGEQGLETLFPGFGARLEGQGARRMEFGTDIRWNQRGAWKVVSESGLELLIQTRPFLEHQLRRDLSERPNVSLRAGCRVKQIQLDPRTRAVQGVAFQQSGDVSSLQADIVVDASGRGSRLAQWLPEGALPALQTDCLEIDLNYATQVFEPAAGATPPATAFMIAPFPPETYRGGFAFPIEGNRWIVTLAGYGQDRPPRDAAAFAEFAASLHAPEIHELLGQLRPVSELKTFRFQNQYWKHYERVKDFPRGLFPIGDSMCSVDPLFGQGMSLSITEAVALGAALKDGASPDKAWARYRSAVQKILAFPWDLTTGELSQYSRWEFPRSRADAVLHAYLFRLFKICEHDQAVYNKFIKVANLIASPAALMSPDVVAKVVLSNLSRSAKSGVSL